MALRSFNNPIASFIDYLSKTGTDASAPVLSSITISLKLWGAGGSGGAAGGWSFGAAAGGGGFVNATFSLPRSTFSGTNLILQVGQAGFPVGTPVQRGFGGGATADNGSPDNRYGGGGGGYTGVFLASVSQANALAIAGGGGGGGSSRAGTGNVGGAGGGTTGADGTAAYDPSAYAGKGGTQSAGGGGTAGALIGGYAPTNNYGGGGGGGYYGGSGGSYNEPNTMAGGGGGSGYVRSIYVIGSSTNAQGSGQTSGGSSDPQWPGSVGTGGGVNAGGQNGFARITINGVETSYSYSGSNVTITL
jgi:hypothetical protein